MPSNGALADHVNALVMKNGTLFAGGLFTNADGDAQADYFAKWTGSAWDNLGSNPAGNHGALGAEDFALLVSGPDIYVGGTFTNAGGGATFTVRDEIKVKTGAVGSSKVTRTITLTSVGDPTKLDAVKVVGNCC